MQRIADALFEIRAHDFNQFFRALALGVSGIAGEDVMAHVTLNHFVHQSIDSAAHGCNQLQEIGAFLFGIEGLFDGFNLAADAADSGQKFPF